MNEQEEAEQKDHFQILDRIRAHLPDVPEEEVERDVAEAIAAVRSEAASEDSRKVIES